MRVSVQRKGLRIYKSEFWAEDFSFFYPPFHISTSFSFPSLFCFSFSSLFSFSLFSSLLHWSFLRWCRPRAVNKPYPSEGIDSDRYRFLGIKHRSVFLLSPAFPPSYKSTINGFSVGFEGPNQPRKELLFQDPYLFSYAQSPKKF